MKNTKKIFWVIFTMALVMNLQFTGSITRNMENGFSLEQLADNVFVPSAFAEIDCQDMQGCITSDARCDSGTIIGAPFCELHCSSGMVIFCGRRY